MISNALLCIHIIPEFIGLDTLIPLATGANIRRVHLDSAASPLPLRSSQDCIAKFLPYYANIHSKVHLSARVSSKAFNWAQHSILDSLGFDKSKYQISFAGFGSTAAINRLARGLAAQRPERPIALVSAMEHHANDLPHRLNSQQTLFIPVIEAPNSNYGSLDFKRLEALLTKHQSAVNYLAINSLSNVTGIKTPINKLCALAHKYDAYVIVDAAQSVAISGAEISSKSIEQPDFLVFSGHKVYTPTAPGVLIAKKELMNALPLSDIGGGAVKSVSAFDYELLENPYREQAGTPNIVGVIALANTLKLLNDIGFSAISQHARNIAKYALGQLLNIDRVIVYGDTHLVRTGAISFNIEGIDHGLVAAILSDYFGVAVRNSCFCAHPYVRSLLTRELWDLDLDGIPDDQQESYINRKRGMVRASFSLYTTLEDIDYFIKSLKEIIINYKSLRGNYNVSPDGDYEHKTFKLVWREFFNP